MAEETDGEVVVPPTLKALLAARLDQLERTERLVLECGAVEGEIFHRGAVQALALDDAQVTPRLAALVRRELIRPDRPQLPGEDGFRFRHLLIRDAAYDALPKSTRGELHERFAAWLEDRADRPRRAGRGPRLPPRAGRSLQGRAGAAGLRAGGAGRRAARRRRPPRSLAGRRPGGRPPARAGARVDPAAAARRPLGARSRGSLQPAPRQQAAVAEQAAERARAAGDQVGEALALVVAAYARSQFEDDAAVDELERLAQAALPLLEQAEDHLGLAWVW